MSESIMDRLAKKGLGAIIGGTGKLIKHVGPKELDRIVDGVEGFTKDILGTDDPDEIEEAIAANPELALELKTKLEELAVKEYELMLEDVQNARARDVEIIKSGRKNTRANVMAYGVLTLGLLIFFALTFMVLSGIPLTSIAANLFSAFMGSVMTFIGMVMQFEFGSSSSSKGKTSDQVQANRDLMDLLKYKDKL